MIEFTDLKHQINILDLVGGLKRVASTGGGEYAGPCPFCGGKDRFRVQPASNIWLCRHCTDGVWRDVVDFVAMRDNVSLAEAARQIGGLSFPGRPGNSGKQREAGRQSRGLSVYRPPKATWQATTETVIPWAMENLHAPTGEKALAYLHKRGLTDATIQHFELGYSPGAEVGGLWVPAGITIPARINGTVWYVKVRTNGAGNRPKYLLVKGSRPAALYNADDLIQTTTCLIVEGEFNAMIAWQETQNAIEDVLGVASMGAAGNRPDLVQWGPYFLNKRLVLALYDGDEAGESGALRLCDTLGERVKLAALPQGSGDLNDYFKAGGDVLHWLAGELTFHYQTDSEKIIQISTRKERL